MGVPETVVERVPAANLHVRRDRFASVWSAAAAAVDGGAGGYAAGVLAACRWLAAQSLREPSGRIDLPVAPASGKDVKAEPESIEEEFFAAVRAAARPGVGAERARGVLATLTWAWHGSGRPPLDVPDSPKQTG